MEKAVAVAAVWLGPALACWATGEPAVALAFVGSVFGTLFLHPPS